MVTNYPSQHHTCTRRHPSHGAGPPAGCHAPQRRLGKHRCQNRACRGDRLRGNAASGRGTPRELCHAHLRRNHTVSSELLVRFAGGLLCPLFQRRSKDVDGVQSKRMLSHQRSATAIPFAGTDVPLPARATPPSPIRNNRAHVFKSVFWAANGLFGSAKGGSGIQSCS